MPEIGERLKDTRGRTYVVRAKIGCGSQGETTRVEETATKEAYIAKTAWPRRADHVGLAHAKRLVELNLSAACRTLLAPSRRLASHVGHLTRESASATTLAVALDAGHCSLLPDAIGIAAQLAAAVAALEARGVVHGDLAPGNVLVSCVRYGRPAAYLIDFDGARGAGLPETHIIGHLECFAPEIARGSCPPTTASDRFSLAVLLYDVLLLRHPLIPLGAEVDPLDYREALARGAVWHEDPDTCESAPGLLPIGRLSTSILSLFRAAFGEPPTRPSPRTWFAELVGALGAIFVCDACGLDFVNDASRDACPACGERRPSFALAVQQSRLVALEEPNGTIGRVHFGTDGGVSEEHLKVRRHGVATLVEDMGSTNGTHVHLDGQWKRLPPGRKLVLEEGLVLRVGRTEAAVVKI